MSNTIELAKSFVPKLDECYRLASLTSVLDGAPELAKQGANANELIIPMMSMDGLADYSRNGGYVQGGVTMTNETVKCNFDRGRRFDVDVMDDLETAGLAFGRLSAQFIRDKVVPELDAFRFASYCGMLNICIVFAQLERETIQKRVTDAYYSRSQRGFKMGGKAPYGFHTEPIKMDGINTKKLVVNPEEAANIRLMFEMYAQPTTSYGDITRYFAEQGILFHGKELIRPTLAQMLRNPVYVQADLDVYEFFKSQGTVIVNDVADFTGMNGCYLYQGRDVKASKKNDLKDQMLVLAPHEGIVPSDTWLTCRKKLMNNMKIQSARKATHTWLAGKIKCGNCGYALMSIYNPSGKQYLRCTKRLDNKSCPGCGKIITSELEAVVYQQMVKKLASYKTLTGKKKAAKANPKITALQVELAHVDSEIEKLVDSLTGANNVLFSYVNVKIAELDGRKQELLARIAELTVEAISPEQVSQISGYLDTWENVSFDDKRRVVDLMITTIAATSDSLNITWKI